MIAATAIANGLTVATRNTRDFERFQRSPCEPVSVSSEAETSQPIFSIIRLANSLVLAFVAPSICRSKS